MKNNAYRNAAYKNAMGRITAGEETIEKILHSASEAEKSGRADIKRTAGRKAKISVFAAALCAFMLCGATAAAIGIIDFRSLFGWLVRVDDSSLANPLLSSISDVTAYVSDDDYQVAVKGVTGDKTSIVSIIEISRVDGTPVADHFLRSTEEKSFSSMTENSGSYIQGKTRSIYFGQSSMGLRVNSKGNIEMTFSGRSASDLSGSVITHGGKNFYPSMEYHNSMRESGVGSGGMDRVRGYYLTDEIGVLTDIPAEFDDSALKLLDLEWEISYVYNPSEAAIKKISCVSPEEECNFIQDVYKMQKGERTNCFVLTGETAENTAKVKLIEIGVLSGRAVIEYPSNELELSRPDEDEFYLLSCSDRNSVYLITCDGVRIPAEFNSGIMAIDKYGGKLRTVRDFTIIYTEDLRERILVEIDRITAISINGTVYPLEQS